MNKAFEKIKVASAEIVVHGTYEKPYYEIRYYDISDGKYHIGYSSYDLSIVYGWLKECFEIVREVAEEYNNGWIPCSERLPQPNQKVIVSYMDRYIGGSYGVCEGQYVYILNSWDISDYMSDDDFEVIAWQPLPEPFKERD